ncbi:glycerate kinase [Saccharothrix ecbatanensis]|uniref:Glycerate kinase n=1 Tax=Saccharothrix ecbatanensis TaxID=1105145 RepID=A0A7W9HGJ5_9PSEU|nr:glycerate kinase [Saccharothrix ecbatanensis]MBB5801815.1 glycerate kinase [Saccharothrix ecbatanensis]
MNGPILVCLDKFRGSLTAEQACAAVVEGVAGAGGWAVGMPVADGGEGTVAALVRAGYDEVQVEVTGPTGELVRAVFAVRGERAVIEMAQASGLDVLPGGRLAPLTADTYGTGELIRAALDRGCRDLVLAVGGSATTDGGAGLLRALGARVTDAAGEPVGPGGGALTGAVRVDLSGLDPRLALARVTLASDVDNPLTGPNGAAAVAPQKGATAGEVEVLERGLCRFAAVMAEEIGRDLSGEPGAGAAGGIGFAALAALDARRTSGADFVLREIGVEDELREASLVVVGEGRFDEQSLRGKAPIGVAEAARRHGVPVVVVAGSVGLTLERLREVGVVAAWSLLERAGDVGTAMRQAPALLRAIGRELVTQGARA